MSQVPPNYTNYPRPSYQTDPFSRPPGVYLDVMGDAWKLVSKDLSTWLLATLVTFVIGGGIFGVIYAALIFFMIGTGYGMAPTDPAGGLSAIFAMAGSQIVLSLAMLVPFSLVYVLPVGMANMAVRQVRGQPISVGDVFLVFRRFGPVFGALVLTMLAYQLGFYLLIVPGLYALAAFSLSPLIAMNYEVGPVEAMKISAQTLGSGAWMMILLSLILGLLWGFSFALCCVGALFMTPIAAASVGLHYHYYFPPTTNAPYVPTEGAPNA